MIGQPLPSQILPKSGPPATTVDLSVGDIVGNFAMSVSTLCKCVKFYSCCYAKFSSDGLVFDVCLIVMQTYCMQFFFSRMATWPCSANK